MERIAGIILRPGAVKSIQLPPAEMRRISESLVDNLVGLHAIDIQSSGLIQLGKPEGYIRRQVEGWTKRYDVAKTDDMEELDVLSSWLSTNQPIDAGTEHAAERVERQLKRSDRTHQGGFARRVRR